MNGEEPKEYPEIFKEIPVGSLDKILKESPKENPRKTMEELRMCFWRNSGGGGILGEYLQRKSPDYFLEGILGKILGRNPRGHSQSSKKFLEKILLQIF